MRSRSSNTTAAQGCRILAGLQACEPRGRLAGCNDADARWALLGTFTPPEGSAPPDSTRSENNAQSGGTESSPNEPDLRSRLDEEEARIRADQLQLRITSWSQPQ
jgi:hypothetical protein